MDVRAVLLVCVCVWVASAAVDHAELRGEHPKQEDIDSGQCVPIPCVLDEPPKECVRLCNLRGYQTICQKPAGFCLCQHMVHGKLTLVSPDEVIEQPPDEEEPSEKSKVARTQEPSKAGMPKVDSKINDGLEEQPNTEDEEVVSFKIFAIFLPIKQFLYDTDGEPTPEPTASLGYEPVNVHEGRLFWDFRYILTGLLLLMIGLVVYEMIMCASQVYGPRQEISVTCEPPEVKVVPILNGKEKIYNI